MNEPLREQITVLVVEDDPGDYGLLRASLRQRLGATPLFDGARFVPAYEAALREAACILVRSPTRHSAGDHRGT